MNSHLSTVPAERSKGWPFMVLALKRITLTAIVAIGVRMMLIAEPAQGSTIQSGTLTYVAGLPVCDCASGGKTCACVINKNP
jgi:hypothetical protein